MKHNEILEMTLKEIDTYFKAISKRIKHDNERNDRRVARILCMMANSKRDTKKKPTPYNEDDFMPREKKQQTPEEMATILKAVTLGLGGEIKNG